MATTPIDATTQTYLNNTAAGNAIEIAVNSLVEAKSGNAAVAQLGRWFSTQHTFLQGGVTVLADQLGATLAPTFNSTQAAEIATLSSLSGTPLDQAYLADDIGNQSVSNDAATQYAGSGTNAMVQAFAAQGAPVLEDHVNQLQTIDESVFGAAAPTATFPTTYPAGPPLNTETATVSGADQTFINNAVNDLTTGVDEGKLALTNHLLANTEVYGAWSIANDGPALSDVQAIATAGGATVPTALTADSTAQITTLMGLTGRAFDTQLASYSITNYQTAITQFKAEINGGADPALTSLAVAATPTAEQLLAQAVIDYGETAGGLVDSSAAPDTFVGAILNAAGNFAATGTAIISGADGQATTPGALATGQTGIQFVNGTEAVASGYAFVVDTAAAPATITGAADQFEAVSGDVNGITYYGGTGGSDVALASGTNLVLNAGGNNFIGIDGGTNTIIAGNGNDTVSSSAGSSKIELGSGNNVVVTGGADTIFSSTGADTIFATAGIDEVLAGSKGLTYAAIGNGIAGSVTSDSAPVTLYGGSGNTLLLAGSSMGNLVVAGAGNETLSAAGSTGTSTFFAGAGADSITGGNTGSAFIAGTGTATLTGGAGENLFQFVNGAAGGADTLGFTSSDVISLVGYSSTAAANAVASQAAVKGGVSFTLTDNTHVTVLGVTSLTATNFV